MFHGEQFNSPASPAPLLILSAVIRANVHLGYCWLFLYSEIWAGCQTAESPWHFYNTCIELLHSMWVRGSNITRRVILAHSVPLSCTNCSNHELFWCFLEILGGLYISWALDSTVWNHWTSYTLLHVQYPACVLGAKHIPAGQIYGACVNCLHSAHRADLPLPRGIGSVPNRLSALQTLKYGALKGFCYACGDFHCLDIQQNSTARINPLGQVKHPGIAGCQLWERARQHCDAIQTPHEFITWIYQWWLQMG